MADVSSIAVLDVVLGLIFVGAVSLGAPFWFDLLNKVSRLRSTGRLEPSPAPPGSNAPPTGVQR